MLSQNNIELRLHQNVRFNVDGNTVFGRIAAMCTRYGNPDYTQDSIMVYEAGKESKFAKVYFPNANELIVI